VIGTSLIIIARKEHISLERMLPVIPKLIVLSEALMTRSLPNNIISVLNVKNINLIRLKVERKL
jgi:hypothetical protein